MKFKVLDLFCGAGGFSAGLDKIKNIDTVIGVDFDKYAIETFKNNFPKATTFCGDITDSNTKSIIINEAKKRKVNMIVGGPPCQGFSLKGKNLGMDDPRNFLFLEYFSVVKSIMPEVFVIENVRNILNAENGFFRDQIINNFTSIGYIINFGVLNAKNFGVPESRERAIIIGSLTKSIDLPIGNFENVTVRDAISDLAFLNSGEGTFEMDYKYEPQSKYQESLRGDKIYNHIATNHSSLALEKLMMIPPECDKSYLPKELLGKQKFSTTWSRLEWDKFSPTIDTRFDTPSNGRNSHPILNRAITPREAARIQSFDDDFVFLGPKVSVCKQIGNAVPPLLGKAIGKTIVDAYEQKVIKNNNYSLYLANSYSMIKELKSEKITVNHIITDPPYNISQENNFSTLNSPRKGVDFGHWDKNFDLYSWIQDYSEILDKDGSMIIFCSYRFISHIIDKLESCGMCVKDTIVWRKSNPMPRNVERRYVQDMEYAVWAVKKNSKWTFNKPNTVGYLRSLFETSVVSGLEKTEHPTQKSLVLMEQIIKIHTNQNDLILDPFMGSGTTGVAAIKNERKFIGIEINSNFFNIAKERIDKNS